MFFLDCSSASEINDLLGHYGSKHLAAIFESTTYWIYFLFTTFISAYQYRLLCTNIYSQYIITHHQEHLRNRVKYQPIEMKG